MEKEAALWKLSFEKYMNQPGKTMNDEGGSQYFFGEHRGERIPHFYRKPEVMFLLQMTNT